MEVEEWIRRSVEVVLACGSTPFDEGAYASMLRQFYLPPSTFRYLHKHWVSPSCVGAAARLFEDAAEEVGAGLGNLGEVWLSRGGFMLAFLWLKYVFEYEYIFLPGDVKNFLRAATVESFDLDTVAGSVWPVLLTYGTPALRALRWARIEVSPRAAARLATPLAVFGAVSDALSVLGAPPDDVNPTGFGTFVYRLAEEVVLFSRFFESRVADVVNSLVAALRMQELLLRETATPSEWHRLAKWASRRYEELGGVPGLYTQLDVESDLAYFLLATVDHYEHGDEGVRSLLRRIPLCTGVELQKALEAVSRRFAMLVR